MERQRRRGRLGRLSVVPLCAGLLVAATAAAAPGARAPSTLSPFAGIHVGEAKLDSALVRIARSARLGGAGGGLASARAQALDVSGRKVRVIVEVRRGQAGAVRTLLRAAGARAVGQAGVLIEALVWPGSLRRLAAAPSIAEVRTPARAVAQELAGASADEIVAAAGPVSEGVAVTNANAWQAAGFDGAGVKVAIIDLGFYGYPEALGDSLPTSVTALDYCDGGMTASPATGGTEHGTGVAEIVHQMAPGAELYLVCVNTEVGLAQAEQAVVAAGVKVVNHSVGWFLTSRGDGSGKPGSPDALVADARAHGILWVNAAGDATDHWSGSFVPNATFPDTHDFAPGDRFNTVTIPTGQQMCAYLKWDGWPTTHEDFDLALVDETNAPPYMLVEFSGNDQAGGPEEPIEALCHTNTGATRNFGIAIARFNAASTPRFDLSVTGVDPEYLVAAGSVIEPATSPKALAVGANCWRSPHYGDALNFYSARGPTIDGRVKPDLVAPDAVSSPTYGASTGTSCANGFTGSSASAPHVAGAAALLLDRTPGLTVGELEGALEATALSHRFADAPNNLVGAGNLWLGGLAPTGSVAFSHAAGGSSTDVWSFSEDGTGMRRLAAAAGSGGFFNPSWSPDGSRLAFTSSSQSPWGVYTVDADGSDLTGALVDMASPSWFNAMWTANGSGITWDDNAAIGLVNPVTQQSTPVHSGVAAASSPDGTKLAFLELAPTRLFVANADGSNAQQLSTGVVGYRLETPAWSPDSQTLAFVTSSSQIWLVGANGSNPRFLTTGTSPQWSADGTTLLFLRSSSILMSIEADGTDEKTVLPEFPFDPAGGVSWRSQPRTAAPVATVDPALAGETRVGQTIRAGTGKWVAASPLAVSYGWTRCNAGGTGCTAILGAHDSGYRLAAADTGMRVRVTVTVTDANGVQSATSALTDVVTGVSGLPGSPTGVTATVGVGQATVTFTPPASSGDSAIVGYTVVASPDAPAATGTSSPITVTGLTGGVTYTFTVTAMNSTGEGLPSASSNAVMPTGPPQAPTGVIATAGDGQASVAFTPPANSGGLPILTYTATASPGGQGATGTAGPIVVGGLTNGQSYTFTVRATNAAGASQPSAPSGPVTPAVPTRPHPDPPPPMPRPPVPDFVAPGPRPPLPGGP